MVMLRGRKVLSLLLAVCMLLTLTPVALGAESIAPLSVPNVAYTPGDDAANELAFRTALATLNEVILPDPSTFVLTNAGAAAVTPGWGPGVIMREGQTLRSVNNNPANVLIDATQLAAPPAFHQNSVFHSQVSNVTMSGFTITAPTGPRTLNFFGGAGGVRNTNITLENIVIAQGGLHGINVNGINTLRIHNVTVAQIDRGYGIHISNSSNVNITGANFSGMAVTNTAWRGAIGLDVSNDYGSTLDTITISADSWPTDLTVPPVTTTVRQGNLAVPFDEALAGIDFESITITGWPYVVMNANRVGIFFNDLEDALEAALGAPSFVIDTGSGNFYIAESDTAGAPIEQELTFDHTDGVGQLEWDGIATLPPGVSVRILYTTDDALAAEQPFAGWSDFDLGNPHDITATDLTLRAVLEFTIQINGVAIVAFSPEVREFCFAPEPPPTMPTSPTPPGMLPTDPADPDPSPEPDREREFHPLYMIGDSFGNFRPLATITRAEVAAILARVHLLDFEIGIDTLPPGMGAFDVFADVTSSHWAYYYIAWAYDAGLIQGAGGAFRPNDPITREEFAAILARTINYRNQAGNFTFADANEISNWALHYAYTVYREGWMVGDARNHFSPGANVLRAEVATGINRILNRVDSQAALRATQVERLYNAIDFGDVASTAWYFAAVVGATNDHYLARYDNGTINWKYVVSN